MTILQFAEEIRKLAGKDCRVEFRPLPQDDPKVRRPDIGRARERLGWRPRSAGPRGCNGRWSTSALPDRGDPLTAGRARVLVPSPLWVRVGGLG